MVLCLGVRLMRCLNSQVMFVNSLIRRLKPILTIFNERPGVFSDVPTHMEMGMNFEPLLRFRGFYVHKDAPKDRVKWLQWAFQRGYCEDSYQKFNESKFMTVIDSYRDTAGSIELINATIPQYREVYKQMGLKLSKTTL